MVFFSIANIMITRQTLSSGFKRQRHVSCVLLRIYLNPEDFEIRSIKHVILMLGLQAERAIRPFVIGRSTWYIFGSPVGATASAGWYSPIETSDLNRVEPYLYLRCILSRLPESNDPDGVGLI